MKDFVRKYILSTFFILCCFESAFAQEHIILRSKAYGMFSMLHYVLYFLDKYDQNEITGLDIEFEETGLYYKKELGTNWWEYYFEPIHFQNNIESQEKTIIKEDDYCLNPKIIDFEFHTPINRMHYLMNKYIKIKPNILEKANKFKQANFYDNYTIGIHYRGTDKVLEANRVSFNDVLDKVFQIISEIPLHRNYKIFVATDEFFFLHYMIYKFGDKVCYLPCHRSVTSVPVHYDLSFDPYIKGEEALLDCLLLSNTDVLIRTNSNLSLCSKYINPVQQTIELNKRLVDPSHSGVQGPVSYTYQNPL